MPTEKQAVQHLSDLGLTEYEARCFVALSRVPTASASEVSTLSDVPRSRVYDAVERLHRRGLVDVQQAEPRRYRALSRDAALDRLRSEYDSKLDAVDEALSQLRRTSDLEEKGAWAISDHDHVSDRVERFIDGADDEVYLLVVDDSILDRQVRDQLAAAADADVSVFVEVASEEVATAFRERVPEASVAVTSLAGDPAEIEGKRLGRIVMVDRRCVLLSAIANRVRPGQREETALWAAGPDHGLVVGIRHVLGERIDPGGQFE